MIIKVSRFGDILTSRPEGREAGLVLLSSDLRNYKSSVDINFTGVEVMTPSWLSEFIKTLTSQGISAVNFIESTNVSVTESIRFIEIEKS